MVTLEKQLISLGIRPEVRKKLIDNLDAIKKHDVATYEHCVRVGLLSAKVNGKHPAILAEMGLMHDVGKTAVDCCLLALTSVTAEQYAAIKVHTRAGYLMLKDELPYGACSAGKHHPTYAVSEYPTELSEEEKKLVDEYVPIVTLCDFYDALTTRNNTAFNYVNRKDPEQVKDVLKKYFPKMEGKIENLIGGMKNGN